MIRLLGTAPALLLATAILSANTSTVGADASASVNGSFGSNFWPFQYEREADPDGRPYRASAFGPIWGHKKSASIETTAVRPLGVNFDDSRLKENRFHFVYPLFNHKTNSQGTEWDILQLVFGSERLASQSRPVQSRYEAWPFFWYNNTGEAATSYWAFAPFYGELKNRFWSDHIKFTLLPLYLRVTKGDEVKTSLPWPFLQFLDGPESRGFELWPLFGKNTRTGEKAYNQTYALWPIYYDYSKKVENSEQPYRRFGVLPFYTRETAEGLKSETYGWPFFGYTKEFEPRKTYNETRYLWPFVIQGRGEEKYINRLLPLYSHEKRGSYEKHWYGWPLLKTESWQEGLLNVERSSFFYFIWWDEKQTAKTEAGSFYARKNHLWPIYSYWNNGGGVRQFQTLSPFEVFFPNNEVIREKYSPLFALYRYDSRPQSTTHSVLWDLITVESRGGDGVFQVGPLFELIRTGDNAYVELFKGLAGFGVEDGESKRRLFWHQF